MLHKKFKISQQNVEIKSYRRTTWYQHWINVILSTLIQFWIQSWNNVKFGLTIKVNLLITYNASDNHMLMWKDNLSSTLKQRRQKYVDLTFIFNQISTLNNVNGNCIKKEWQLYLKRDSGTGVFLWILQNFWEQFFYRIRPVAASEQLIAKSC